MKKVGITGSISSGKTTVSKILSAGKGPFFCADLIVKKLYSKNIFKKDISKKFNIKNSKNIKKVIIQKILENQKNLKIIEKIIHPVVRNEIKKFIKRNKKKKFIFLEIPLLIENKLMKFFDIIIFVKAKRSVRLKRFKEKGGSKKLFTILNNKQLSDAKKIKYSDHIIVNENNKKILKNHLLDILEKYE
tara:strand:- start:5009 stop:5575 length:567 start_codon:yes stop_codon:yes gene_type:complete